MGDKLRRRRSQWVDSNHRPPASETGALAKLSHTEMVAVAGLEPPAPCLPAAAHRCDLVMLLAASPAEAGALAMPRYTTILATRTGNAPVISTLTG